MKRPLRILLKVFIWGIILIFSFYFFAILIFGFKAVNPDGSRFYWSGLEAVWEDDEHLAFHTKEIMTAEFDGADGPYIVSDTLYYVNTENEIEFRKLSRTDTITVRVNTEQKDSFSFTLNPNMAIPDAIYEMPQRIAVLSDIEGNFNGLSSFLINNHIIDANYNWTFGDGHLVLTGDFVDRGNHVTQVLWLIYKLEMQAEKQGGKVHLILGNHEIMNFQGNWRYNKRKYIKLAQTISKEKDWDKATRFMYSHHTELGNWLRSKNVIEKIGRYIFVHAGLSPEIQKYKVSLPDINRIARNSWDKNLYNEEENNNVENFISGKNGVYWYRGLAFQKITEQALDEVLQFYQADKIVFGHTIQEDITKTFNGKAINIDVKHGQEKHSEKTKGLLIEAGVAYKLDGKGTKMKL